MNAKQKQVSNMTKNLQEKAEKCILIAGYDEGIAFAIKGTKVELVVSLASAMEEDPKFKSLLEEAIALHDAKQMLFDRAKDLKLQAPTMKGKN